MTISTLIKKSRSYRRFYESHRLSKKILVELVELARFSPCMRNQQALKFILSYEREKNDLIFPALKWAGALKDWNGPTIGERPTAYIVLVSDSGISHDVGPDHGIAAQSILLGAVEKKLGGCMIGSIDRGLLRRNLHIPPYFNILLVVALGKPREKIVLEDVKKRGGTTYYRDKRGVHHVPKRRLEGLIVE